MPTEGVENLAFADADDFLKTNVENDASDLGRVDLNSYPVKPAQQTDTKPEDGAASVSASAPSGVNTGTVKPGSVVDCGYGSCRPSALQFCNNPKVFIVWLSWFTFIQGFVINGVNNLNTTTIEKRFNLPSQKVGLISGIYDISAGIFVIPVTVYGSISHQPRLLALAAFFMSIGSFIMALPHFSTGLYELGDPIAETCDPSSNGTVLSCEGSTISNYLYVFLLGQFLNGIGGTTLYTLGYVYMDSNVSTKSSPVYQGIMLMFSTVGPAVGYLLGGYMLSFYVDVDKVDSSLLTITEKDPRWVGAWWIGFLIASGLLLTIVVAMYPYPKLMPAGIEAQSQRISQAHNDGSEAVVNDEDFLHNWKNILTSFRFVLTNPVLIFLTMGLITEGLVLSGFATFLPKIIQNQFVQTASWAALLAGFIVVPGAALGNITSGLILRFMKLKVSGMLRLCVIVCFTAMAFTFIALARCDLARLAGVAVPYVGQSAENGFSALSLTTSCNAMCGCTTESYEPVCGVDSIQYFSPCHAGCSDSFSKDGSKVYDNCSCIPVFNATYDHQATEGPCGADCNKMGIFLAVFLIVIYVAFMVNVPSVNTTLRCLPDKQRLIGIGVQAVFVRFLGTFPGPLLFGYVFDEACIQWQEVCGVQGSCWVYDNGKLAVNLLILGVVLKFFSAVFFGGALFFYKPPPECANMEMEGIENKTYANGDFPQEKHDKMASAGNMEGIDNKAYTNSDASQDQIDQIKPSDNAVI